jgi:hypothetical protein
VQLLQSIAIWSSPFPLCVVKTFDFQPPSNHPFYWIGAGIAPWYSLYSAKKHTKMSSGFVSAGTNQEPVERDDEWLRVQRELEEERRRKAELGKQDGKSLYDVLQQNKSE